MGTLKICHNRLSRVKDVAVQFMSLRLFYVTNLCQLMNNCVPKYYFHVSLIGNVELGDGFQKVLAVHSP